MGNISLQDLAEARLEIELAILKSAVNRRTNDDLALLQKNIDDSEKQIDEVKNFINFHILLARSSKNYLFEIVAESIMHVTTSVIESFRPEMKYVKRILQFHKQIYAAVKEQDLKKAREKMEEHVLDVNRKHMAIAKKIRVPNK